MNESRLQLSEDTWVYVDEERSKLIVEIDIPKEAPKELEALKTVSSGSSSPST